MPIKSIIHAALSHFGHSLTTKFALPGNANPEDQLKKPVEDLLAAIGTAMGKRINVRTEAQLREAGARPDMAIYADGLICGYVELKQRNFGADPTRFRDAHSKKQWEKLSNLPNIIYTDGCDWTLWHQGERAGALFRLDGDPYEDGKKAAGTNDGAAFEPMLRDFLFWAPIVPHNPRELAAYLAPITLFLREEVLEALPEETSSVHLLANEWRGYFFPDADDNQFADAYAQTVTYALLLARLNGADKLDPVDAAKVLDKGNGLLAQSLKLLGQDEARAELRVGFELLQRSLEALDPGQFLRDRPELWLYFYEDFLAAYDPVLRRDYGVYYTPVEVVKAQVRLASDLLEKKFKKKLGFADDGIVFLDPAVGTGTYLVAATKHALELVRQRSGEGAVAARASQIAANMYGFEILVGPYAVAHLRLAQIIEGARGTLPDGRLKVYLADTLESPFTTPPSGLTLTHKKLTEEHEAARLIKRSGDILVCLGNPPYDRQQIEEADTATKKKGGWVRYGDLGQDIAHETKKEKPIFDAFLDPARQAGAGVHLKNIYNDYVYFWRWALWRLFERQQTGGIITFITASSYLVGPGFAGVREVMRRTFDELWIINLGGDNLGPRKTENIFAIQNPVAIAIGFRGTKANFETPATVHYAKIEGTRAEKLVALGGIAGFADLIWADCSRGWQDPLLPIGRGEFFHWPELGQIFPWQHTGSQYKRSWPISESEDVLRARWKKLARASLTEKTNLFKNTRDRTTATRLRWNFGNLTGPISELTSKKPMPEIKRYAFRAFDRQYAIRDMRVGDYLKRSLIELEGEKQIYFSTLFTQPLGVGPCVLVSSNAPDLHYFCGRGGKDIIPLWRNSQSTSSNVTSGLLTSLEKHFGRLVTPDDLAGYAYAILANSSFVQRFWEELETPGPRLPITKRAALFFESADQGRHLIWLHTYAERMRGIGRGEDVPQGRARCAQAISGSPSEYPQDFSYIEAEQVLRVGDGLFSPVSPEIWGYSVSDLPIVTSWLAYRMKRRFGRRSSPLDNIRPEQWTPTMTDELLELLWVIEATVAMEPELAGLLDQVISSECFTALELPTPTAAENTAPRFGADDDQLGMFNETHEGTDDQEVEA